MKRIIAYTFATLCALVLTFNVGAQAAESIWLTAETTTYKTGETVLLNINASSTTPIQGFTFQILYDPSCLHPVNASSPIPEMNGLPLPQLTGLVDGSYASTTPQAVNGVLAEVKFSALKGCQTSLYLEEAVLAVRSAEGFAVPLTGVLIGERNVSLYIDKEVGVTNSSQPESGSILPLDPPEAQGTSAWITGLIYVMLFGLLIIGVSKLFRKRKSYRESFTRPSTGIRRAALHIKHGPNNGKSITLNKLPVLLGRDPQNDICINDPHVVARHAQIYSERNGYYLRDLGGGTFINGRSMKNNTAVLQAGNVVRLGKSFLFVFG